MGLNWKYESGSNFENHKKAKVSSNDVSDGSLRFRQKNKIGLNCSVALDPEHVGNTSGKVKNVHLYVLFVRKYILRIFYILHILFYSRHYRQ